MIRTPGSSLFPFVLHCLLVFVAVGSPASPISAQTGTTESTAKRFVEFRGDQKVLIPAPRLSPAMSFAQRLEYAKELTSKIGWDQWSGDSLNSSVVIEIEPITNAEGDQVGHRVFSAYSVYATLEQLQSKGLLEQVNAIQGAESSSSTKEDADSSPFSDNELNTENPSADKASTEKANTELTAEQLKAIGIVQLSDADEKYAVVQLPLLNKVEVTGVMRTEKQISAESILLQWNLVEDIPRSSRLAARWRKSERNDLGELVTSEPQPYSGLGGYVHITMLDPATSLAIVESTMIIQEPQEWFSGSRFLRSKLPLLLQESARDFRRALEKVKAE